MQARIGRRCHEKVWETVCTSASGNIDVIPALAHSVICVILLKKVQLLLRRIVRGKGRKPVVRLMCRKIPLQFLKALKLAGGKAIQTL